MKHERDRGRLDFTGERPHDVAHRFTTAFKQQGLLVDGVLSRARVSTGNARLALGEDSTADATRSTAQTTTHGSSDGVRGLKGISVSQFRKVCALYKCIICRNPDGDDHRAQTCPVATQCGYKIEWKGVKKFDRGAARKATTTTVSPPVVEDVNDSSSSDDDYGQYTNVGKCKRSTTMDAKATDQACPDSGVTSDMHMHRNDFETYQPLDNSCVTMGDGTRVPALGKGTIILCIAGHSLRLNNVLHVPSLDVTLLSIRIHRRRRGCSFSATNEGMYLIFPSFRILVNDEVDALLQVESSPKGAPADYDDTRHTARLLGQAALVRKSTGRLRRVSTRSQRQDPDPRDITVDPNGDLPFISNLTPRGDYPTLPSSAVAESGRASTVRYSSMDLHRLLGNRKLADYSILADLGDGLAVDHRVEPHPGDVDISLGTVVNQKRRKRNRNSKEPTRRLQKVSMDIGYGHGASPGGAKYCLVLVDGFSHHASVYGLNGITGLDVQDALWRYFIDAGGLPECIQCDYDPRFLGGVVRRLLHSKGIRIRSSPPNRQSQNGLVERT
jgi:hypothetical protein